MKKSKDYDNMADNELFIHVATLIEEGGSVVYEVCKALFALDSRGLFHPAMKHALYARFKEVATGKLAAEAATAFAGDFRVLDNMIGMPLDKQRELATGATVQVAEVRTGGSIVSVDRKLSELSPTKVPLVLNGGSLVPFAQQKKMLSSIVKEQAKAKVTVIPHKSDLVEIIVNKKDNTVTVGSTTVDITVLLKALVAGGVNVMMSKAA